MTTITGRTAATTETSGLARASTRWRTILKRALQVSFLFFLLKGIAWLVVGFLAWQGLT